MATRLAAAETSPWQAIALDTQSNPLDVAISQEAHYRINPPNYQPPRPTDGTDPYEAANKKPSAPDRMVKFLIDFII